MWKSIDIVVFVGETINMCVWLCFNAVLGVDVWMCVCVYMFEGHFLEIRLFMQAIKRCLLRHKHSTPKSIERIYAF